MWDIEAAGRWPMWTWEGREREPPGNRAAGACEIFVVKGSEFEPAYLRLFETGELRQRVERGLAGLADSTLCRRDFRRQRLRFLFRPV